MAQPFAVRMEVGRRHFLFATLLMVVTLYLTSCSAKTCEKSCPISRAHRMLMADCYHQELKEFPCLRSDIEVIDVSLNRIRRLEEEDLQQFSSLRILYLMENMIMRIDERAFIGQNDLEVLDLTMNSFNSLPSAIFELPSLRRLILGHNENANIVEIIDNVDKITSPLEYLDLSYNRMERLPILSALPTLLSYNISGNDNLEMSTQHFAGLCNLIELLDDNVTYRFSFPCECWILRNWLRKRNVRFKTFDCDDLIQEDECNGAEIPIRDLEDFESCKLSHDKLLQKAKLMNIILPIVFIVVVALIIVILVLVIRWRRRTRSNANCTWNNHHDEAKHSLNKNSL